MHIQLRYGEFKTLDLSFDSPFVDPFRSRHKHSWPAFVAAFPILPSFRAFAADRTG